MITEQLRYVLLFTTNAPTFEAEEWLDEFCDGAWSIAVEDMSEDLKKKVLKIKFSKEDDKLLFKDQFVTGKWKMEKRSAPDDAQKADQDHGTASGGYRGPERRSGYDRRQSPPGKAPPSTGSGGDFF